MAATGTAAASGASGVGASGLTGAAPAPGPLYYTDPFSVGIGQAPSAPQNPTQAQQLGNTPVGEGRCTCCIRPIPIFD